ISLPCISLIRCCSFHFFLFKARIIFSFIRVKRCFNVFFLRIFGRFCRSFSNPLVNTLLL
ncbi:Ribosomal RNA small subunit methyltransferase A, partial [Haemophilus influenzae]